MQKKYDPILFNQIFSSYQLIIKYTNQINFYSAAIITIFNNLEITNNIQFKSQNQLSTFFHNLKSVNNHWLKFYNTKVIKKNRLMISNYDFLKKNSHEIFREQCSYLTKTIKNFQEKLQNLRIILYKCGQKTLKPLEDSSLDEDVRLIQNLRRKIKNNEQRQTFKKTIQALFLYKQEFQLICQTVDKNLKKYVQNINIRNLSANHKMYENIKETRIKIQIYFSSLEDSDSPCKIRSEIFTF
ncbi:hypothetical protein TTHERM_00161520 (macronuclear) [Tetrahymena thermophila SB210]|uniref:Uncharacterized protein n=1 Tax=Tetrahymena thermophila (strain SB210) TaxID=312017 RepID=Q22VY2_TETTS|nr:hypothetical protein TTHERM_00161520 [Tetrahymena thermophila SB210]EAR89634.2 hypothetical protein TTHERM_00161520 [Tetrahymena thermophila SB210]|eukprot:XP_001009880.2 hypothetical protein TTHERM_00161520 [Tetrahymena thermophila SB210]